MRVNVNYNGTKEEFNKLELLVINGNQYYKREYVDTRMKTFVKMLIDEKVLAVVPGQENHFKTLISN